MGLGHLLEPADCVACFFSHGPKLSLRLALSKLKVVSIFCTMDDEIVKLIFYVAFMYLLIS